MKILKFASNSFLFMEMFSFPDSILATELEAMEILIEDPYVGLELDKFGSFLDHAITKRS